MVSQDKCGVFKCPLKETLEIATILLDFGQHVQLQNTVPQAGLLSQETPFIQGRSLEELHGISHSGVNAQPSTSSGHVGDCDSKGRRKKQAKPHRVLPSKRQTQDFKVLIVPQAALFCSPALPCSISQILGLSPTSNHGPTRRNAEQNDGKKFSPLDIDIPFEWSTAPRENEDMFFPRLKDSSYKAEVP